MSSDRALAGTDFTNAMWDRFGSLQRNDLPDDVAAAARHCVLDWFGCAVAGSTEPLSQILREEFAAADGVCSLVGSQGKSDALRAAMVNGATGHALDFDDTSVVMGGHATVPLLPAVLALAEEQGKSGADVVTAYVVGMEVQSRIGTSIGGDHYRKGWHTTSTIGVFGAAAACSWILGLDAEGFGRAMGIAASNASGVKANFGTMTKPLHPGQAAERGLLAARLAARGYTANAAAIDGNQGLAQAAGDGSLDQERIDRWDNDWATPKTVFKFHAACHLTHAGIDATTSVLQGGMTAADITSITLTVNPDILDVCGIVDPTDGLEAKFSLRGTQALLLAGFDTAAIETFADGPISDADVRAEMAKVKIETDTDLMSMRTVATIDAAGEKHRVDVDVSRPATDLDDQGRRLRVKFDALAGPILGVVRTAELGDALEAIDDVASVATVLSMASPNT